MYTTSTSCRRPEEYRSAGRCWLSQQWGLEVQWRIRLQEGVVPVCIFVHCLWLGYIFLKTKNIIFFFNIKVFAKSRNYNKKKTKKKICESLLQRCTPRLRWLCPLQAAAFSPRVGSFCGPHVGEAVCITSDLQPEGRASQHITGHFRTCDFGVRVQAGTHRISRGRDTPQVRYQVLKLWGFALFQSHFRLLSFNKTITIACVVCLFVPENLHLLHTGLESRNWR